MASAQPQKTRANAGYKRWVAYQVRVFPCATHGLPDKSFNLVTHGQWFSPKSIVFELPVNFPLINGQPQLT